MSNSGDHNHSVTMHRTWKSGSDIKTVWSYNEHYDTDGTFTTSNNGLHTHTINNAGGNQAHENRMPYIVVNRWKRTA